MNELNGVSHIKRSLNAGELIGLGLGIVVFSVTIYAMSLAIKAHKLTIKKLESEGVKN